MKHLKDNNMTYLQHMRHAMCLSAMLFVASSCCLIHAFMPFIFETTASKIITHLGESVKNAN